MSREQSQREQPIQLPEHGFEHPFQDSDRGFENSLHDSDDDPFRYSKRNAELHQGKERLRTVSGGFPALMRVFDAALPDRRAADVCVVSSYQRKAQLVGEGQRQGHR